MVFGAHCYVVDSTFSTHFYKEGFVGVSFFFILSGFIIAYNYQQKLVERKVSKRQFWVARIARIYPLHIATLLGVAVIGNLLNPMGWGEGLKHFIPALFLLHPFVPRMDYFFISTVLPGVWDVNSCFISCFRFSVVFAKKQKLIGALLVCAVVVPVLMSMTDETNIRGYWYVNPLARFPDFLVGMLLYRVYEWCRSKSCLSLQRHCSK